MANKKSIKEEAKTITKKSTSKITKTTKTTKKVAEKTTKKVVAKTKNQILVVGSGTVNIKGRNIIISIIDVIAIIAKPFSLFLTIVLQPA